MFVQFKYLCCSLSVSLSLNVRCTTNRVWAKTYIHICGANKRRQNPYTRNVCEFLGTNYCIPKRCLMGHLQQSFPPLAQTTSYTTGFHPSPTSILLEPLLSIDEFQQHPWITDWLPRTIPSLFPPMKRYSNFQLSVYGEIDVSALRSSLLQQ